MELKINEEGIIESDETTADMTRPENIEMLQDLAKAAICSDIENALTQARLLDADVFGFGDAIRNNYPKSWESMKNSWDTLFPTIGLDINVEFKLRSSGSLTKPVIPGGAAQ